MKHRYLLASLVLPLTLLAACGKAAEDKPVARSGHVVAVVYGKSITKSEFDLYVENVGSQSKRGVTEAEKTQLLDQFISMKLAADAAEKEGIQKDAKVSDQLN